MKKFLVFCNDHQGLFCFGVMFIALLCITFPMMTMVSYFLHWHWLITTLFTVFTLIEFALLIEFILQFIANEADDYIHTFYI